jgi:hypothetical protein
MAYFFLKTKIHALLHRPLVNGKPVMAKQPTFPPGRTSQESEPDRYRTFEPPQSPERERGDEGGTFPCCNPLKSPEMRLESPPAHVMGAADQHSGQQLGVIWRERLRQMDSGRADPSRAS